MIENCKFFWTKYLPWLCLIPIVIYFIVFQKYAANIPHWDDYALIKFCNNFWSAPSIYEKLSLIFKQHNEHRIAFTRVVSLLVTSLNGSLNFKWLMWLGNIFLIGIFYLYYQVIVELKLPKISILIPSLVIFQLSHFENTFWGMAVVQNFGVVYFMMLVTRQLASNKIPYIYTFLAVFTSANAILLLPIIGLMVFLTAKDYKKMSIYLAFCIILSVIYFTAYQSPPDVKPLDFTAPFQNLKASIVYIGAIFDFNQNYDINKRILITFLLSVFLLIGYIFLLYKYVFKRYLLNLKIEAGILFLFAIVLLLIGTGLLAGLIRIQYGFYVFLVSRYRIYSIIGFTSISLLSIYFTNIKYQQYLTYCWLILVAILYVATYYTNMFTIKQYRKNEIASYYNSWHVTGKSVINSNKTSFKYENTFLNKTPTDTLKGENFHLSKIKLSANELLITNKNYEIGNNIDDGAYLLFKSDSNQYVFATNQSQSNSLKRIITFNNKYLSGFEANVPMNELASGDYFIDLLSKRGDSLKLIKTNYYIEINTKKQKDKVQNW